MRSCLTPAWSRRREDPRAPRLKPHVIRTFEAMANSEQMKNVLERVVLLPVRLRHRRRARPKHKARAAALATVTNTLKQARELKSENLKTVFNVGLFLLLLDQDLADFSDDLLGAIGDRCRRFVAKHEAVLLYEAAEDVPQLLGKEFRQAAEALGTPEDLMKRLNDVSSDLSKFWEEHREFLRAIRNAVAAHREYDALRYREILEALEPLEVMRRAADLSGHLERLISVLSGIALLTASPVAIVRDMLESRTKMRAG